MLFIHSINPVRNGKVFFNLTIYELNYMNEVTLCTSSLVMNILDFLGSIYFDFFILTNYVPLGKWNSVVLMDYFWLGAQE